MLPAILDFIRQVRTDLSIPAGNCLEVGSFDVNGSPRVCFTDADSYWGIDMQAGPGVDQVGEAEVILGNQYPATWNTVICCECLEHTLHPWVIVEQMKIVLKLGGYLWISTPTFGFPLHRYPIDTFRFGEDAYRQWMFADLYLLALAQVVDEVGNPAIVAVGQKRLPVTAGGAAANVTTAPVD
jgi:SAM-dependent methyltransferase